MNFIMKLILITNIYLSIFAASKKEYPKIPRNDSTDFATIIAQTTSLKKSPIPQVQSTEFYTPTASPINHAPVTFPPKLQTKPIDAVQIDVSEWDDLKQDFDCVVVHTDQGPVKKYFSKKTFKK